MALTACGDAAAEKQAGCRRALGFVAAQFEATETDRPDGCEGVSQEDYMHLLKAEVARGDDR
ncbi:hypothetical protein ACIRF8_30190 [Streptomyces sp. NPDC102406]|uniref:hypothetical protein n=1 Tax=Streptomyces sp. NPDC102406 TaxID=3366171 RepID=UPI003805FE90